MAEIDRDQRTEAPSEKRRLLAREDGRIAQSTDLTFALTLTAAVLTLLWCGSRIRDTFFSQLSAVFDAMGTPGADLGPGHATIAIKEFLAAGLSCVAPMFVVLMPVVALSALMQIGFHPVPAKLTPKPEKLIPNLSPSRFVNGKSLIDTAVSILKLALLVAAAWSATSGRIAPLFAAADAGTVVTLATSLGARLLLSVGGALVLLGFADLFWKRRDLEKDLRMTKDEARQEAKDSQGDPEVRGRIRRRQREFGMRRMMDEVPTATAVITNPTHFAIALRWQTGMSAPKVIAKGRDFVAQRIKELARAANVPIVENPPLARTLFQACEIGGEIPPALYQAVAEVLAAILRSRKRLGRTA